MKRILTMINERESLRVYYSGDTLQGSNPEDVVPESRIMLTKEKLRPKNKAQAARLANIEKDRESAK